MLPRFCSKAWRDFVQTRLDEKTFANADDREKFLRNVYESLTTGVHIAGAEPTCTAPWFEGSSNIARKISQNRELFWKDGRSWAEYMNRYGIAQSWDDLMVKAAQSNARQAALMQFWGSIPAGNLNMRRRGSIYSRRRSVPVTTMSISRLPHLEQISRSRQSGTGISAP
jgi:hypothetical protein